MVQINVESMNEVEKSISMGLEYAKKSYNLKLDKIGTPNVQIGFRLRTSLTENLRTCTIINSANLGDIISEKISLLSLFAFN